MHKKFKTILFWITWFACGFITTYATFDRIRDIRCIQPLDVICGAGCIAAGPVLLAPLALVYGGIYIDQHYNWCVIPKKEKKDGSGSRPTTIPKSSR